MVQGLYCRQIADQLYWSASYEEAECHVGRVRLCIAFLPQDSAQVKSWLSLLDFLEHCWQAKYRPPFCSPHAWVFQSKQGHMPTA